MKSYTDLEQSKKLAEILPLESADMYYMETSCDNYTIGVLQRMETDMLLNHAEYYKMSPCWSLAALLELMPKIGANEPKLCKRYYIYAPLIRYVCIYGLLKDTKEYDNPVDACYEIIVWLKEINKL